MVYTADFETTTDVDDCRVWAAGMYNVVSERFEYTNSLDAFMKWAFSKNKPTIYFHNLKFDGEFILYWLLKHEFKHSSKRFPPEQCFTTLISDKGQFYSICAKMNGNTVKFLDSLKIIPLPIKKIPKAFGLEESKGEIDYNEKREIGHILTDEEVEYLKGDVVIAGKAVLHMLNENMKKLTSGANALAQYKTLVGKQRFEKWFPPPISYDNFVRKAYRGGFTFVNPLWQGKDVGDGIVLDVNSLYPSVMYSMPLPFGEGVYYEGAYQPDDHYPLFVQKLECRFELKEGFLPTLQLKNSTAFKPTEYIESSQGDLIELYMTSVDLKLFMEHYHVWDVIYICGYKFQASDTMFKAYIDRWMETKAKASIEGNEGLRTIAKLMMNALYGKFGTNPVGASKYPFLDGERVRYKTMAQEVRNMVYIPVAVFVTAYARDKTIRSAQKCGDRFIYADTDSLHLVGTDIPKFLDVDDVKLGYWAHESTFKKGRFLRAKCYIEDEGEKLKITCAGMPERCYNYGEGVTWENFQYGTAFGGKLAFTHVDGGVVLTDTTFEIKKDG